MMFDELLAMNTDLNFNAILCGDYNTSPNQPTYNFMVDRPGMKSERLLKFLTPKDHNDGDRNSLTKIVNEGVNGWKHNNRNPESELDFKRLDEVAKILEHANNFPLCKSLYGNYTTLVPESKDASARWEGEPSFTSYALWKGTIDYVFLFPTRKEENSSPSMVPKAIRALPSAKELEPLIGLPNDKFGSDHLYLQAELVLI